MLNAKCASCGGKHETIDDYRSCFGARQEAQSAVSVMDNLTGQKTTINPPSDAQVKFAMDLLGQKQWPDKITEDDLRGMERRQVSELINGLKAQPFKEGAQGPKSAKDQWPDIIASRYALCIDEAQDVWRFYEVSKPTRGKWVGYTFVVQLIGSPGDYRKQRLGNQVSDGVLKAIMDVGVEKSVANFGLKSETCGICHSPLSNDESIKRGIGPICASKVGW